ncbi:MAG TPA: acylphosphatase [Candidatus Nanoarchaeia archaeon]|nr:acylphosphatase [Candidatus Nanoarchaeia archaeon]
MKKSVRLYLTGSVQSLFMKQFIKNKAEENDVKGFLRAMDDGRMEIFIEGDVDNVRAMVEVCKQGPKHAIIRSVEEKEERHQGFKDFKIMTI